MWLLQHYLSILSFCLAWSLLLPTTPPQPPPSVSQSLPIHSPSRPSLSLLPTSSLPTKLPSPIQHSLPLPAALTQTPQPRQLQNPLTQTSSPQQPPPLRLPFSPTFCLCFLPSFFRSKSVAGSTSVFFGEH